MQKKLLFLCLSLSVVSLCHAQWCVPNTIVPYSSAMPGITNVTINTINRTSSDLENYPNNSYVSTGLSTTLQIGVMNTISITHTIDGSICPDMNLRVYIDYNNDYQLDDPGEIVITVDHHPPGIYTGFFTVPASVTPGIKRMRVAAKMSNLGGHTLPTPCDLPPDPFGYHGEMEDYTVNITTATGIHDLSNTITGFEVYPNPVTDASMLTYELVKSSAVTLKICNMLGEIVYNVSSKQPAGIHQVPFSPVNLNPGIYMISLTAGDAMLNKRVLVPSK
jgi:hypothetical protein